MDKVLLKTAQIRLALGGRPGEDSDDSSAVPVDVYVRPNGEFTATVDDEEFTGDTLRRLIHHVTDALVASRFEVAFVTDTGRRGVLRGYHGGTREFLVTWQDGTKGRIRTYERVFRAEEVTEDQIEELRSLAAERRRIEERVREIRRGMSEAAAVFSEVFGEDITRRHEAAVV
jgi:hypothetical protein